MRRDAQRTPFHLTPSRTPKILGLIDLVSFGLHCHYYALRGSLLARPFFSRRRTKNTHEQHALQVAFLPSHSELFLLTMNRVVDVVRHARTRTHSHAHTHATYTQAFIIDVLLTFFIVYFDGTRLPLPFYPLSQHARTCLPWQTNEDAGLLTIMTLPFTT